MFRRTPQDLVPTSRVAMGALLIALGAQGALTACHKLNSQDSDSMVSPAGLGVGTDSCGLNSTVKQLVNPTGQNPDNEARFYELVRSEGMEKPAKLSGVLSRLNAALTEGQCFRGARGCFVDLVSSKVRKGLVTLDRIKYGQTLKFKEVAGQTPLVFVRASGIKPEIDPRQPEGLVIDRYHNRYHWVFRKAAGDLHPGFIWAALAGSVPWDLTDPRDYRSIHCYETYSQCSNAEYKRAVGLFFTMINRGYVIPIARGEMEKDRGLGDIYNLFVVNSSAGKIDAFAKDEAIIKAIEKSFGKTQAPHVVATVTNLMKERSKPGLVPNAKGKYELTKSTLKSMGVELPTVSAKGWTVYFADHHRITAAHDLGMAIEVGFSKEFISLN